MKQAAVKGPGFHWPTGLSKDGKRAALVIAAVVAAVVIAAWLLWTNGFMEWTLFEE